MTVSSNFNNIKSINNYETTNKYHKIIDILSLTSLITLSLPSLSYSIDRDVSYNLRNERLYDTRRKSYLPSHPELYLKKELADKKIIMLGEVHTNPLHHQIEFRMLYTLAGLLGTKNLALGMECFYRQHQQALDNFIFKHGSIKTLKEETKWKETWGYDLSQYAKILNYCFINKIRLVGLNVPLPVIQFVATNGLNQFPDKYKYILPVMDLSNKKHKNNFIHSIISMDSAGLSNHGGSNGLSKLQIEHLYESQTLWDEYMSESVSDFIKSNRAVTLLVIAGSGHINGRVGIPDRVYSRTQEVPFVITPYEIDWSVDGLPVIDSPPGTSDCDWVWFTEKEIKNI